MGAALLELLAEHRSFVVHLVSAPSLAVPLALVVWVIQSGGYQALIDPLTREQERWREARATRALDLLRGQLDSKQVGGDEECLLELHKWHALHNQILRRRLTLKTSPFVVAAWAVMGVATYALHGFGVEDRTVAVFVLGSVVGLIWSLWLCLPIVWTVFQQGLPKERGSGEESVNVDASGR